MADLKFMHDEAAPAETWLEEEAASDAGRVFLGDGLPLVGYTASCGIDYILGDAFTSRMG